MNHWQAIKNYLINRDNEIVTRMNLIGPIRQVAVEGDLDWNYDLHEISVIVRDAKNQYWAADAGNPSNDVYGSLTGPFESYYEARRMLMSPDGKLGSSLPETDISHSQGFELKVDEDLKGVAYLKLPSYPRSKIKFIRRTVGLREGGSIVNFDFDENDVLIGIAIIS